MEAVTVLVLVAVGCTEKEPVTEGSALREEVALTLGVVQASLRMQ